MDSGLRGTQRGHVLGQVWKALKELSPKNVGVEAARAVRLGVVAPEGLCRQTAASLLGDEPDAYDRAADSLLLLPTPLDPGAFDLLPRCDLLLVSSDYRESLPGVATEQIFTFSSEDDLPDVIRQILRSNEIGYAHLPLARRFPALRPEAAAATVQAISIENAVFVTSTSLGNIVPNPLQPLAALAESVGDLVVLTANQLRMLFQLAAIYDQKLGFREQAPEALSILGAAFGWRSIARELVSKIPLGGGVVPKAAIAFAGTWAIGDGIAYYYATGRRLTKEELRERFDAAYEKGKAAAEAVVSKLKDGYSRGRARLARKPDKATE